VFRHIVVGCDGSPEGRDAVALGAAIASVTGASLSLVGVFPTAFLPVAGSTDRRTLRAQATRALRRERDRFAPQALIQTVADISVPRALRHYAESWQADLVIVGSSPAAAPGHVAIARRGRQLLYDAPFSLGLAARGLRERGVKLRAVGAGYDAGPESETALAVAADLAHGADARLLVRRVVEDIVPALSSAGFLAATGWTHDLWETAREEALAEAQSATAALDVRADASATIGDPGYELRALTEMVDLVVVGSRRWGPVARLVSGGVGETLVADASCSVLIVPRPPAGSRGRTTDRRARAAPAQLRPKPGSDRRRPVGALDGARVLRSGRGAGRHRREVANGVVAGS
jgi:nucleotide-binding universal stress UspA family protein